MIILDDNGAVMFAFDSAELTPAAQQRLQGLVAKLDSPTVAKVSVIGHTDNVGSDSYNQALFRTPRQQRGRLPDRPGAGGGQGHQPGARRE
ncbi:OmpA/MotB domain-containing protein [Pseudomonas putida S11]|nr:OmpA/MotB domain-containing protein [Pseudomonas putida S11]